MNPSASSIPITEALLSFVFILLVAFAAVSYLVLPAVVPASAPATDFSAERAVEHLKVIAREPHPTRSIANARARDYLVEQLKRQGLEAQIQRTGEWLVREIAKAVPHPLTASIDLFPWFVGLDSTELDSAIPTLEGGFSGCRTAYHTRMDNLQNLDPRSIQDEENYTLAVAHDLADLDIKQTRVEHRLVYFAFFGRLIVYPMPWALPLMIITLSLFVGVLLLAFRRGRLSGCGLGLSLLLWPAAAATASGAVAFLWWVLQALLEPLGYFSEHACSVFRATHSSMN